ncbi:Rieske (2Fe-2S) protein [Caulobacter segnis]|nr:Rieske (2Fe-2S) protein [Caulobacter segnis]MDG2521199.1 Rieske (2Fe-2S) protein [Caulobacter segnis]
MARGHREAGLIENFARPAPGTRLCALDEVAEPGAKGFRFRTGEAMFAGFVVRRAGTLVGYVDSCPHAGWPLAMMDRYLTRDGNALLCAGHGALFRPEDGFCTVGPCAGESLTPWPVAVEDGWIVTT